METILKLLRSRFPKLSFTKSETFCWSPSTREVLYANTYEASAVWSLLHETSHALLEHNTYKSDFELLHLEVEAWEQAKRLAGDFGVDIDENYIQDCLDTYRDWLYARSICPQCGNKCLQWSDLKHYYCFNCHAVWKVTRSRLCRVYRSTSQYQANQLESHAMEK